MNGIIYARFSSSRQKEESIEGQIRECTAYAEHNGIKIVDTYIARALTGKTDNRPSFQRMIKDSVNRTFDVVLVWKLDRFARNRADSSIYKKALSKNKVKVISATENIGEGSAGIIYESVIEGVNESYSVELAEKVIRGQTENALKCKYNGGTTTFGYIIDADHHFQIDAHKAPVVFDIFKRYSEGSTMKEISDYLNSNGIKTARGKKIDLSFVYNALHNRRYIGEYKYRDILIADGIPVIIPQDLFDRVQEQLEKNKKAPARHKAEDDYILTMKLYCGTCKSLMVGESGTSQNKQVYHYYRCVNSKKKKECTSKHKTVKKHPIENAVVNAVMEKIMDDGFVKYMADNVMEVQAQENRELPILRRQLEEADKGIQNMLNAIQAGIITPSTKQRLEELEKEKGELEISIVKEEAQRPQLTREDVMFWIRRFRTLDITQLDARRRLIDSFVNSVVVYDDYILITFNYKDGSKTISFKDIKSSDLDSPLGP